MQRQTDDRNSLPKPTHSCGLPLWWSVAVNPQPMLIRDRTKDGEKRERNRERERERREE